MAEDSKSQILETNGSEESNPHKESSTRRAGKYFLVLVFIGLQLVAAWFVVDRFYEPVTEWVTDVRSGGPFFVDLERLVVNPDGSHGQRYLLVEITLELGGQDGVERLDRERYRVRHTVREILSGRTVDQLVRAEVREEMRSEIREEVNRLIGAGTVHNLYYSRYVMQ